VIDTDKSGSVEVAELTAFIEGALNTKEILKIFEEDSSGPLSPRLNLILTLTL